MAQNNNSQEQNYEFLKLDYQTEFKNMAYPNSPIYSPNIEMVSLTTSKNFQKLNSKEFVETTLDYFDNANKRNVRNPLEAAERFVFVEHNGRQALMANPFYDSTFKENKKIHDDFKKEYLVFKTESTHKNEKFKENVENYLKLNILKGIDLYCGEYHNDNDRSCKGLANAIQKTTDELKKINSNLKQEIKNFDTEYNFNPIYYNDLGEYSGASVRFFEKETKETQGFKFFEKVLEFAKDEIQRMKDDNIYNENDIHCQLHQKTINNLDTEILEFKDRINNINEINADILEYKKEYDDDTDEIELLHFNQTYIDKTLGEAKKVFIDGLRVEDGNNIIGMEAATNVFAVANAELMLAQEYGITTTNTCPLDPVSFDNNSFREFKKQTNSKLGLGMQIDDEINIKNAFIQTERLYDAGILELNEQIDGIICNKYDNGIFLQARQDYLYEKLEPNYQNLERLNTEYNSVEKQIRNTENHLYIADHCQEILSQNKEFNEMERQLNENLMDTEQELKNKLNDLNKDLNYLIREIPRLEQNIIIKETENENTIFQNVKAEKGQTIIFNLDNQDNFFELENKKDQYLYDKGNSNINKEYNCVFIKQDTNTISHYNYSSFAFDDPNNIGFQKTKEQIKPLQELKFNSMLNGLKTLRENNPTNPIILSFKDKYFVDSTPTSYNDLLKDKKFQDLKDKTCKELAIHQTVGLYEKMEKMEFMEINTQLKMKKECKNELLKAKSLINTQLKIKRITGEINMEAEKEKALKAKQVQKLESQQSEQSKGRSR